MLIIKIQNVDGTKQIADYHYSVLINLEEIASGSITGHKRSEGWVTLVQKMIEAYQETKSEKNRG